MKKLKAKSFLSIVLVVISIGPARSVFANSYQSVAVRNQLNKQLSKLYYPSSVIRFYNTANFNLVWITPDSVKNHASDAMLLLDCVRQYGLNYADYHPDQLLYQRLNTLSVNYAKTSMAEKAEFDVFLTDAMIRLVNDIHYGKLNPTFTAKALDHGETDGVKAEAVVNFALHDVNFVRKIESAQPTSEQYRDLQRQLHQMAGVLTGDCYDLPEARIRQIAVNMERLRWMPIKGDRYIQVNIPSMTLKLHQQNADLSFPVMVGKIQNPINMRSGLLTGVHIGEPMPHVGRSLPSSLNEMSYVEKRSYQLYDLDGRLIAPTAANLATAQQNPAKYHVTLPAVQASANQITFELKGLPDISLSGRTDGNLFKIKRPTAITLPIRLAQAKNLANTLLQQDGNTQAAAALDKIVRAKQRRIYPLKRPLPIYITYLTCGIKDGLLETYDDTYGLDNRIAVLLYKDAKTVDANQ